MTKRPDITTPLDEFTPEQLGVYVDDHLVMVLRAADLLRTDRQTSEDYVRDRLVAISDTYASRQQLATEESRRKRARLVDALKLHHTESGRSRCTCGLHHTDPRCPRHGTPE